MKRGDAFPSQYLAKEDLAGGEVTVRVDKVTFETVGFGRDAETKPVLYFAPPINGKTSFVLNNTNWGILEEDITGQEDSDDWSGAAFTLYVDPKVEFGGKRVGGLRVKPPVGEGGGPPAQSLRKPSQQERVRKTAADQPLPSQQATAGGKLSAAHAGRLTGIIKSTAQRAPEPANEMQAIANHLKDVFGLSSEQKIRDLPDEHFDQAYEIVEQWFEGDDPLSGDLDEDVI